MKRGLDVCGKARQRNLSVHFVRSVVQFLFTTESTEYTE
jgi:hypothetical protein